jgi:hypothetical protein
MAGNKRCEEVNLESLRDMERILLGNQAKQMKEFSRKAFDVRGHLL